MIDKEEHFQRTKVTSLSFMVQFLIFYFDDNIVLVAYVYFHILNEFNFYALI